MPPLNPVPNVIKVQFVHTWGGVNIFVHQFLRYSGAAPTQADATAIANSCKSAWVTNLAALAHTSVSLQYAQVTDLASPTGGQGQSSTAAAGTRSGFAMTANDCLLVNQHIQRRYRGGKPRQYWPFGVIADTADPQHWSGTFTAAAATAYNAFISALSAITWGGTTVAGPVNVGYYHKFTVVISPTTGRAKNVPTPLPTPNVDTITSSSINSRIATQRRREHFSA